MNERVLTLFSTHQNPVTKLSVVEKKYFLPNEETANEEAEAVKNRINNFALILNSERVDKRNARSIGALIDASNTVKIMKTVGINLGFIGFCYDKCKCLNPQEALYLLETNRMEILHNSIPLSMQDSYNVFLDSNPTEKATLNSYRIYRKLAIDGFKLTLSKDWCLKTEDENRQVKRRKHDVTVPETTETSKDANILNVFNRLKQNAPKIFSQIIRIDCDYKMYYPTNAKKKGEPDLDVYVHKSRDVNPKYGFLDNKALFGVVTPNNIAFYRVGKVKLPSL